MALLSQIIEELSLPNLIQCRETPQSMEQVSCLIPLNYFLCYLMVGEYDYRQMATRGL